MVYQLLIITLGILCNAAYAMETKKISGLLEEEAEAQVIWVKPTDGDVIAIPVATATLSKILVPVPGTAPTIESSHEKPYTLQENQTTAQLFINILGKLAHIEQLPDGIEKQRSLVELNNTVQDKTIDEMLSLYVMAHRLDAPAAEKFIISRIVPTLLKKPQDLVFIAQNITGSVIPMSTPALKRFIQIIAATYPQLFSQRFGFTPPTITPLNLTPAEIREITNQNTVAVNPVFPIRATTASVASPRVREVRIGTIVVNGEQTSISMAQDYIDHQVFSKEVTALAWSPDGKMLAAASTANMTNWDFARLFRLEPNLTLTSGNQENIDAFLTGYECRSLAWHPSGTILACGRIGNVRLKRLEPDGQWKGNALINLDNNRFIESINFDETGSTITLKTFAGHQDIRRGFELSNGQQYVYSSVSGLWLNQALLLPMLDQLIRTPQGRILLDKNRNLIQGAINSYGEQERQLLTELYLSFQLSPEEKAKAELEATSCASAVPAQVTAPSVQQDLALLHNSLMALSGAV